MPRSVTNTIGAAHGADLERLIQRQQRAAHEGVLRLDQVVSVQVKRAYQLLGRLDRGRQLTLTADSIEDGRERRVFEVDHPATQAWKQERLAALALPRRVGHVFAPVNLETDTLRDGLDAAGFEWSQPTLFSWLGVTMYLTTEANAAHRRRVRTRLRDRVELHCHAALSRRSGLEFRETIERLIAQGGEPLQTELSPDEAEALIAAG